LAGAVHFLQWFVHLYEHYLPPGERERFLGMTLGEIARTPLADLLRADVTRALAEEGRWRLAAAHRIIGRRKKE
jgi:hypothetical protein